MGREVGIEDEGPRKDTARALIALVVDDVEADRLRVASLAQARGFEIVEAEDGASALAAADAHLPDLVVLDIGLPDIDGLRMLASMREQHPLVPVVVVSSTGDSAQVEEALDLGAVNFVRKPVTAEELGFVLDRIRRALREESDLQEVLDLVTERRTRLSFRGEPALLSRVVAYLGRELRLHYPGYLVPVADVKLALYESLANAIEHGNLEIDYDSKTEAMARSGALEQLVTERLADPRFGRRHVHLEALYHRDLVEYRIRDEGRGFDPVAFEARRALADTTALHGRGLALIRHYMDDVGWSHGGSEIRMRRRLVRRRPRPVSSPPIPPG
jgi:CheY-like chemotaxis protein